MKIERQIPKNQPAEARIKNFDEVNKGFTKKQALIESGRCLNCKNAPCKAGCPVNVDIPAFINLIKKDDVNGALNCIMQTNGLPAVCGRVCPQETQCEERCVRAKTGGAVAIGALERFAADNGGGSVPRQIKIDKTAKKVAVIGSGPASLTCAGDLAKAGIKVTVFEAFHKCGGVLVYGIPEFRLPKKLVQKEIDYLIKKLSVKFETNVVIGKTITIDQLKKEYDGIFIGTGAGLPMFMNIKGENLNGVYSANEYLTRVNLMNAYKEDSITPVQKGKNVVVVGAGNVAMDAARTAVRLGAENVSVVYRRGRDEMPARQEEIQHAEEEGVKLCLLTNPVEISGENGRVKAIKCVKTRLTEPDASGRRKSAAVDGTEFIIDCDTVIMAIGTSPNPILREESNVKTKENGTIIVNGEMQTSDESIYAGGDAVTGAATVILAMGSGKIAAKALIKRLLKN